MSDISKYKASLAKDIEESRFKSELSNPLSDVGSQSRPGLENYTKDIPRPKYDSDISEVAEIVRILNNMAPLRMPEYNFNTEEINGERYARPDGTLLLIREYDSDVIRDYYVSKEDEGRISYIKEHDKHSGRLRVRIEPITRAGSRLKANITIFDEKISKKYTIIQLSEGGMVNNITEFSGEGKSFRTLFRNIQTTKPARYLEGKDSKENGFEMIDCIFDQNGSIARIKRYNNKREVNINYTEKTKSVTVKTKD